MAEERKPLAIFLADLHWTTLAPEYRKETGDFSKVIAKKLAKVYDYVGKNGNPPVFIAGDVFDRSREFIDMWSFKEFMTDILNDAPRLSLLCIRGQHDMFHHNAEDKATSLNAVADIFRHKVGVLDRGFMALPDNGGTHLYSCGWGCDTPEPNDKDAFNILLWHKGLWRGKSPYPGAEGGNVETLSVKLHEMGYDMVFSGDYHEAWDAKVGGVEFYNLGCFSRRDIRYAKQQPRFCVLFDDLTVESIYVGDTDVFDTNRSEADKQRDIVKDEFSTALALTYKTDVTIRGALTDIVRSGKCNDIELNKNQLDMLRDVLACSED